MLEQKPVINFLVTEKSKPFEIYWKIYDVYREACFSWKMCLTQQAWVKKTVYVLKTYVVASISFQTIFLYRHLKLS